MAVAAVDPTGAAKAGHDFIVDEKDAVFVAQGAELRIVVIGRNEQAVGAGDAFAHNRGDVGGAFHLDNFVDVADAFAIAGFHFLAEGTTVTIRIEGADDAGNAGFDGPAAGIAGSGHRAHGGAVIGAVAGDDLVAAGEQARHLHGVFVGFGAAERIEGFGKAGDFSEFFAESATGFSGETGSSEAEFIDLLLNGLEKFRMLVADVEIDQLRGKIEPAIVVAIPEPDALPAFEVHGIGGGLNGPGEHRIVAILLDDLFGIRSHEGKTFLDMKGRDNGRGRGTGRQWEGR